MSRAFQLPAMAPRDRRALTIAALLLLPSLGYVFGVKPYLAALADARQQLAVARADLSRDLGLVRLAPRSAALRASLDSTLALADARLFSAPDDGVAAADLGAYVGDLAREHQVWLQNSTSRATQVSPQGLRTLAVDIRAESDYQGIAAFLRALEEGERWIRVDQLSLVPATDTTGSPHALQLRATVMGYALGAPPPARPSASGRRR